MNGDKLQSFDGRTIRTAWIEETEEWYFSVQDVVIVLTESNDPKQYIKKMRSRDPELSANWGTICTPVQMKAHQPEGFTENQKIARRGGSYAGQVRKNIEQDTGKPVITSQNATSLNTVVTGIIESISDSGDDDDTRNKK